jgi:hypothetical protein
MITILAENDRLRFLECDVAPLVGANSAFVASPRSRGDRSRRTIADVVVASVRSALKQASGDSFVFGFRLVMPTGVGLTKKMSIRNRPELAQNIFFVFREPEITKVATIGIERHLITQCLFELFD